MHDIKQIIQEEIEKFEKQELPKPSLGPKTYVKL
jgi:hypothetical protein